MDVNRKHHCLATKRKSILKFTVWMNSKITVQVNGDKERRSHRYDVTGWSRLFT